MSVIGVPIKVLHEAEGHIVTVETTTGEVRTLIMFISIQIESMSYEQLCKN